MKSLIETEFPIDGISEACKKEKSIRLGHISTLQQWWARRPLAICRAAIFAALAPSPDYVANHNELNLALGKFVSSNGNPSDQLVELTTKLSQWDTIKNNELLSFANRLIMAERTQKPLIVDTFAGGGSFPLEALRLGLDTFAGELNPVASTALRAAIEYLPRSGTDIVRKFKLITQELSRQIQQATQNIYQTREGNQVLAYLWCHVYQCPSCGFETPLLRDNWLARGNHKVAIRLIPNLGLRKFDFEIFYPNTQEEISASSKGNVSSKGAICSNCCHKVPTSWLREEGCSNRLGDLLYAKCVLNPDGIKKYEPADEYDRQVASECNLREIPTRNLSSVPDISLDLNGVRHTWVIQYGIKSTEALYNHRQKVALLELFHEMEKVKAELLQKGDDDSKCLIILLSLTLNRLVSYGNRHSWWQSNGEFPANIFTRQAIPMVWNYVEIPVSSPGAAGWTSASYWIENAIKTLVNLPSKGVVWQGDAALCPLEDNVADLVTVDPPYYDSVAYSYLSDVYYGWMKAYLGDILVNDFLGSSSPKIQEAIVDRKHSLSPSPKTKKHFYIKMRDAFIQAKRILKPDGRLLLMFGHKHMEAWDALISALLESGFIPVTSWPIHTERKTKFRHNYIDALSSSVLLICKPLDEFPVDSIDYKEFILILKDVLKSSMLKFRVANIMGSDLVGSLVAPAMALYCHYKQINDDKKSITAGHLLSELPRLVAESEYELLTTPNGLNRPAIMAEVVMTLLTNRQSWLQIASNHPITSSAASFAKCLYDGNASAADEIWQGLSTIDQEVLIDFFRIAAVLSPEKSIDKQQAQASLSRISHQLTMNHKI